MDQQDWQKVGELLGKQLQDAALRWLQGHADDSLALGADTVKAILSAEVYQAVAVPALRSGATAEEIAAREEFLQGQTRGLELIAAASVQNAERVQKLKEDAAEFGKQAATIIGSVGVQVLLQLVTHL